MLFLDLTAVFSRSLSLSLSLSLFLCSFAQHFKVAEDRLIPGIGGTMQIQVSADDESKASPELLTSRVIQHLTDLASLHVPSGRCSHVMIAVPNDVVFNDVACKSFDIAVRQAGVQSLGVERQALCAIHGIDQEIMESETISEEEKESWWIPGRKIVVCDVGRSVEATLMELGDRREATILHSESGTPYVGGSAMDQVVLDKILYDFERENKMDLQSDPMSLTRVVDAVQTAKHELSTKLQAEINLPYITADATGPKHLVATVKRAQFIRDVDPVVQGMLAPVKRLALKASEMMEEEKKSSDKSSEEVPLPPPLLFVIGGCARSEYLRETITGVFGKEWEAQMLEMPEEAVVTGAAVLAARGAGWK